MKNGPDLPGQGRYHTFEGFVKTLIVEPRGLEPLTPCLQSRCATNCAMAPQSGPPPGSREADRAPALAAREVGGRFSGRGNRVGRLGPEVLLRLVGLDLPVDQQTADGSHCEQKQFLHVATSLLVDVCVPELNSRGAGSEL